MLRLDPARPFVLLDDARQRGAAPARLFKHPIATVEARATGDVAALLEQLRAWTRAGHHVAGLLTYEAGFGLAAGEAVAPLDGWPLGWFGAFAAPERIARDAVADRLPHPAAAALGAPRPRIDRATYAARMERVLDHIREGDFYQANLTFAADVAVHGDPLAAYARLRDGQRAGYGGIVWTGTQLLLSFSPELFFALDAERRIVARPMKGTAARGTTAQADARAASTLAQDQKQRAENLMIVDLLRNDLSRVAAAGSVAVPALFRVETYPTVHQMVSDVTATLAPGRDAVDVIAATFPCGSITGAPKRSAMQRLRVIEGGPRGAYTGSVGFIAPDGDAAFNVAIRSLALVPVAEGGLPITPSAATLGLGSGIVADSQADDEWAECGTKGAFVDSGAPRFDLIETMAFDPERGIVLLDRHLARLSASAHALGFGFDRHALRNRLQYTCFRWSEPARVRVRLGRSGAMAVIVDAMPPAPAELTATLVPRGAPGGDVRFLHKTSDRTRHRDARDAAGDAHEALWVDDDGGLCEGSWTSLFVERDGALLTPPLCRGILPGVLRAELIERGRAREAELTADDLGEGFWLGNALRGLMRARLASPDPVAPAAAAL